MAIKIDTNKIIESFKHKNIILCLKCIKFIEI